MTSTEEINLIPPQNFEDQPTSRKLFLWMTGAGRVIVIVTELIAILVWLSRFRLDYEITTLQENIEEKAALVATSSRFERNFRKYQDKILAIQTVQGEKVRYSNGFETLATLVPDEVRITSLTFSAREIQVQAQATSAIAFAEMLAALLGSEDIEAVALSSTRFSGDDGSYLFAISLAVTEDIFND